MSENTAAKPHNVVIYARVARDEPRAVEQQVASLRQVATTHGWTVLRVITEVRPSGISNQALAAICTADVVIVRGEDRLSRNLTQLISIRQTLLGQGVQVVSGGRSQTAQEVEQNLAVLRALGEPSRSGRMTVLRRPEEVVVGGRGQALFGHGVTHDGVAPRHPLIEQTFNAMRDMDRGDLSRRTRAGIVEAAARREGRR
jgi:DNA invertase Pin-like site-specific DNA recombinase